MKTVTCAAVKQTGLYSEFEPWFPDPYSADRMTLTDLLHRHHLPCSPVCSATESPQTPAAPPALSAQRAGKTRDLTLGHLHIPVTFCLIDVHAQYPDKLLGRLWLLHLHSLLCWKDKLGLIQRTDLKNAVCYRDKHNLPREPL